MILSSHESTYIHIYIHTCIFMGNGIFPPLHFVTFPNLMSLGSLGLRV